MTFPPQPHVGGVVLPAALVRGAHGKQLPPVPGQAATTGPQRQAVVGDVDEARVFSAAGEASASLPVPPGVCFIPMVGAHRHGQHAQGAQRKSEPGIEQQLSGSHARMSQPHQHLHGRTAPLQLPHWFSSHHPWKAASGPLSRRRLCGDRRRISPGDTAIV